jgi:hypothetical protein
VNASRRKLLVWTAALGAGLAAGAFALFPVVRVNARSWASRLARSGSTPKAKLLRHFSYLKISDDVAERYVADYRAHVRDVGRLSELGDDFHTRFLLSTDFFQHGADESRPLEYVAIYGPTITLCYNPLAKL